MRVIAGRAKGRRLAGPPSRATRPTSDLVRGAIFSALEAMGAELTRVLDLYAGSGALGIEALSRGARWCDFVEKNGRACASIRENLAKTGFDEQARVHCAPVERAASRLEGPYTLVLSDPPYAQAATEALERLAETGLVEAGTTVLVLEHSSREDAPEGLGGLSQVKTLKHGDSAVSIYR
ncbi:MAG: 16S rRNA (guanine(966)-N(2))-methyltransferase RsmD [Chloroflexi bacterium]|nr:16S rRNA (guanine(966)-N(2))-methyltransferase RsmD [Chloroflexota bacterium]